MEETLRDKLAMSMSSDSVPVINNKETIEYIAEKFGLEWSDEDPIIQMEFAFAYNAIVRYKYADAMLKVR